MANWRVRPGFFFRWQGKRLPELTPVVGITDEEADRYANLEQFTSEEIPSDVKHNSRTKPKASPPGDSGGDALEAS